MFYEQSRLSGFIDKSFPYCHPEYFQVKAERPVLDVIKVIFKPLINRGILPESMYLCPSCNTGFDFMPEHVFGYFFPEFFDKNRPFRTRSHQTHLPLQNIDELGNFIQTKFSQKLTEFRYSWVTREAHDRACL